MNIKVLCRISMALLYIGLTACSDYQPRLLDDGTVIAANTLLNVSVMNSPQLIPNQYPEVALSVNKLANIDVSGVIISGTISVNTLTSRADFSAESISFNAKGSDQTLAFKGVVVDSNKEAGLKVECRKKQDSQCGLYDFINHSNEWTIVTQEALDLSSVTVLSKSSG